MRNEAEEITKNGLSGQEKPHHIVGSHIKARSADAHLSEKDILCRSWHQARR
jgi:hypothetical protein